MTRLRLNPTAPLLAAAVVALAWANSPWDAGYHDLWHGWRHTAVNDGLMSLFFLAVGMEVKHELVHGELRDRRHAALPMIAAVGGMAVPALLYAAIARDHGWGIPMATDIAFAVGVVNALRHRVPRSLVVFLLTLAVVDDIGAIVVIAAFYRGGAPVHPTLVAALAGLLTPARHAHRVERRLRPINAYLVLPVFALANAGVALGDAAATKVSVAVVVGLVIGKPLGITLATVVATRHNLARLPDGLTVRHIVGVGLVAGIGFTVSLFVADLAFADPARLAEAKAAVLAASTAAALAGAAYLARS